MPATWRRPRAPRFRQYLRAAENPAAKLVEEGRVGRSPWAKFELPKDLLSFRSKRRRFNAAERTRRAAQLAGSAQVHAARDNADPNRRIVAAASEDGR